MLATQKARDGFTFIDSVLLGSWSLGADDPLSVVAHLVADGSTPTTWLAEVWFVGDTLDRRPFGAFRVELEPAARTSQRRCRDPLMTVERAGRPVREPAIEERALDFALSRSRQRQRYRRRRLGWTKETYQGIMLR